MEVKNIKIVTSQLGFRIESDKSLKLVPGNYKENLPDKIKFYIQSVGNRLQREQNISDAWNEKTFRWPFDIGKGKIDSNEQNYMSWHKKPLYSGTLVKEETSWGVFWQGDFTDFKTSGIYQIETEFGFSLPFVIEKYPYERLNRSYLIYLFAQRSGMEIPGVRPLENAHDGSRRNVYKKSAGVNPTKRRNASTTGRVSNGRARTSSKPNNMYTDNRGNVHQRNKDGSWSQKSNRTANSKSRPSTSQSYAKPKTGNSSNNRSSSQQQLNKSYNSRSRGNQSYNRSRSTTSRSSGMRTGGGRRR